MVSADPQPPARAFSRIAAIAGAVIALAFLIFGALSIQRYGLTVDEPALLYAGDRTLYAARHPTEPHVLDFRQEAPPGFHSHFHVTGEAMDPQHYPVLAGLVEAVTGAALSGVSSSIAPVDAHHAGLLSIHAAMLFLFTIYASRLLGDVGGIAAGIMLALFPCAVGHAFNNPKDWTCAGMYGLTVLSAAVSFVERRPKHMWWCGVFLGLSLAFKLNGAFAAITVALCAPIAYALFHRRRSAGEPFPWRLFVPLALVPVIGWLIFFVSWPWLWAGRPADWVARTHEYLRFLIAYGRSDRTTFSAYPFLCLFFMTPPLVLVAAARGAWLDRQATAEQRFAKIVLLVWLGLPLLRIAVPHSNYYDANRHFIEYVPALCALGGAGVADLRRWALGRWSAQRVNELALAGVAMLVWPVAEYHPFETAYFNVFAGGLGGAQAHALLRTPKSMDSRAPGTEGDFWMNSLREGVTTAEQFVTPGKIIAVCGWSVHIAEMEGGGETNDWVEDPKASVLYVNPRECWCGWSKVRELERTRKVLYREERGGGLIYELLGPATRGAHAPVSPVSEYETVPQAP